MVRRLAVERGLRIEWRKEYRQLFTRYLPSNFHD